MAVISKSFVKSMFFLIIVLFTSCTSARLNVPRVLLPYNLDLPINYTLEISGGGCYRWTSSRTEVATITPIDVFPDHECSAKALVSAVSQQRARHSTIILAEDSGHNQLLRCDVIVDVIHSIEIITTTRELFLEDAPEEFEVTAKNDQEDTFSSLNGVAFEWTLEPKDQTGSSESVLRFLKFSDSPYETPFHINQWEQQRLQGDKVLVEGWQTGSSLVKAQLRHPSYKDVKKSEVNLVVVANLVLNPAHDVYLLPNSVMHYHVELIKQGRAHEVKMPSEEYFLEIRNPSIVKLNTESSDVTAMALGHTEITLKDHNSGHRGKDPPRQPTAGIHVVEPSYMIFQVSPGENWALKEFTEYEVTVKIFDDRHHRIYPTENLRIRVHFPSKHFNINFAAPNGTYFQVKTLLPGPTKITGELQGILGTNGKVIGSTNVKQTQEAIIYQALQVEPSVVLMPWDDIRKPSYTITLKARGATGIFHWASNDTSLVSVSYKPDQASKLAMLKTQGMGDVIISVKDVQNSIFKSSATISVQPVADLEILPTVVEAEIGNEVVIPLALYGYEDVLKTKRKIFDDCSDVPITVEIVDQMKIEFNPDAKFPAMGQGCRSLAFLCKAIGHSRINVQYAARDLLLKTTAIVACHKPLKPVFPSRVLLLPIGSLSDIAFEGGPRAWPMFQEGHFTKMTLSDPNMARRTLIKDPHRFNRDLHVFRILCKDLGEQVLEISVGNEKSATNQNPAILTASIQLFCGVPETVFLKPVVKGPTGKKLPCPIGEEPVPIPVHNYRKLEVDIWAKDQKGRKFANITSLDITWEVSDYNLAKPENPRDVKIDENSATGFLKLARSYQVINPAGKIGQVKLTATILGYRSDVLRKEEIPFQERFPEPISRSIILNLVEDVSVDPSTVTVFNHATNKVILTISQGSGHFFVEASDKTKASIEYSENMRQIAIIPLEDGSQSITVHDLCLETRNLAVTQVRVSGVEAIQVKMIDKVELNKTVIAIVQVLGHQLQPIPASLFPLIDLQAIPSSPLIGASFQGIAEGSDTQAMFSVTGLVLGHSSLTFEMRGTPSNTSGSIEAGEVLAKGYRGRPVTSSPQPVQVFSPLRLSPSNITLLVGAVLQVTCWGGPQPQSSIEFLLQDQEVAMVSGSGVLTASHLGHTTLIARAVDTHPDNGHTVVYSQDQVSVFVVALNGIKIHSPLRRLQTHSIIPLHVVGPNEHENPFVFGSAVPPLLFKWTVSNPEVLKLQSFYKQPLSQLNEDLNFAVQVVALRPGHATVSLRVELSEVAPEEVKVQLRAQGALLKDEVQFHVLERLILIQPAHVLGGDILITPNTRLQLKSNRDGLARVQYAVKGGGASSLVSVEGAGLLVSKALAGDSVLTITAQEDFGLKQSAALLVKVRPLSYLMVSCVSPIRTRERPLNALPIGMTVTLQVTSHDSIGRIFHGSNVQLKFRPSRFDIIQINEGLENGTLVVTASKPGQVVLKVWDSYNPHIADYIPIRVSSAIVPSKSAFSIGDVICFDCPIVTSEDQKGFWTSESPVLNIHSQSGMAVALEAGQAQVYYNVSGTQITSSQVTISPVTSLNVDTSLVPHVTNVKNSRFDVNVFLGDYAKKIKSNKHGFNCSSNLPKVKPPFSCSLTFEGQTAVDVNINQLFETHPDFDLNTGVYMCSVLTQSGEHNVLPETSLLGQGVLLLHVQMGSLQETVRLPFYPAFNLHVHELQLSNVQPIATLGILAVGKVAELITVTPSDPNVLEVLLAESDARLPHTLLFPVQLRDLSSLWQIDTLTSILYLTVSCTFTKQTMQLPVKLKLLGSSGSSAGSGSCTLPPPPNQSVPWYDNLLMTSIFVIIITAFAIYIGYKVILSSVQKKSRGSSEGVVLTRNSPGYPYIPYRATDSPDPSRPFLWSLDNSMSHSPRLHTTPQTPPINRTPRS